MKFIDEASILVKGGDGGNGCVAFRREKFVPKGGPSGGDGGNGGSVIAKGNRNLTSLLDLRYQKQYIAKRGQHGMGSLCHGKSAEDIIVEVPLGTIFLDENTNQILAEVLEDQQELILAKGGRGGLGNSHFATPTNRAPRHATDGKQGQERMVRVQLKLLADVGLVGFPNAGKSTLISSISAAKPKIADYPFTTLVPNLGIVYHAPAESFVVADIPGIIEGAAEGKGLGHQFLKHIERTRVLLFLIPVDSPDKIMELETLRQELSKFDSTLIDKPWLILVTKTDIQEPEPSDLLQLKSRFPDVPIYPVSSISRTGLDPVIHDCWLRVKAVMDEEHIPEEEKADPSPWRP